MVLIPQKLFDLPSVQVILRAGNNCILEKTLTREVTRRAGYVSNHVISIVLAGEQQITTYDEETITVQSGEVLLIPRGMYYTTDLLPAAGAFRCLLFYFDDEAIREFLASSKLTDLPPREAADHLKLGLVPVMRTFTEQLLLLYRGSDAGNATVLRLKQQEMLHLLNEVVGADTLARFLFRLTLPRKRNLRPFLEANYAKPLTVEDYAYLTGRSVSSFRRDFKAHFGLSPNRWLREQRMNKALELLEERGASVRSVALDVGYQNTSYFIRTFREKTGLSPKQYMLARRQDHFEN